MITQLNTNKLSVVAALAALVLLSGGCEKKMSITEFSADYADYRTELRVEAILDATDPWNTIVRIDRTILLTDTTIFNGRDDDGDWVGYSDENGNGKWDKGEPLNDDLGEDGIAAGVGGAPDDLIEPDKGQGDGRPTRGEPHIDELDEVLPQIHDTTAVVRLYNNDTGALVAEFTWFPAADSFAVDNNREDSDLETVTYGAYKPVSINELIAFGTEYQFRIESTTQGLITGNTTPLPPAEFDLTDMTVIADTIYADTSHTGYLQWDADPEGTVFWVIVEQIFAADSAVMITSKPWSTFLENQDGRQVSFDFLSEYFVGLYRWTVVVPSPEYGAYIYSTLPLDDEQLTNLRDSNGDVVLGIAGSVAETVQYVRIVETLP
ncbi:MAG: hypothetical protein ABIA75_15180 [Candidatus Neomarinimicrobiota bacterium]